MNFNNMNYFMVIAEEGSISAASRKLFISQQSLSEQLKKIETEVGTPLFKRGKKLTMTLAGQCFYDGCKHLTQEYSNLLYDVKAITSERYNKIAIGLPTFGIPPYFPEILASFQAKYPEYKIAVVKRQHIDIAHNMDGVDLYFSALPLNPELENHILVENDPYCITFQRSLALKVYGDRWDSIEEQLLETQDLSLLKDMPFAILCDRYGQMAPHQADVFAEYGFRPIVEFTSENGEINDNACLNGIGCVLAPSSYVTIRFFTHPDPQAEELLSFPIKVNSFLTKLAISHVKGLHLHPAENYFIKECKDYFDAHEIY